MKFDDDDEFENEPIEPIPGQMCYDELLTPIEELEEEKPDTSIAAGQLDMWNLKPENQNEKEQEKIEKKENETKKNERKNEINNQNFEAEKIEKNERIEDDKNFEKIKNDAKNLQKSRFFENNEIKNEEKQTKNGEEKNEIKAQKIEKNEPSVCHPERSRIFLENLSQRTSSTERGISASQGIFHNEDPDQPRSFQSLRSCQDDTDNLTDKKIDENNNTTEKENDMKKDENFEEMKMNFDDGSQNAEEKDEKLDASTSERHDDTGNSVGGYYGGNGVLFKPLEEVLHDSMIPYTEHVVLDRALPRVEDGLKPVQRRILYSMLELGLTPDKPYRKSARIVGDCMGKYHPHGDSSVYDAMVRMSQDFSLRAPLVDGHGNFGSVDGDSAAAMRYTEARMTPLAMELLRDLEKDTVRWGLNFDDTLKEPDVLPGRFSNLLVNGTSGIAVGVATNIPPHNLGEVIDGVVAYIDNPNITLEQMMKIIKGPDFPTGGELIFGDGLRQAYETGKGKITIRAKVAIEQNGDKQNLVITELPYQVNKALLLQKIAELKDKNKDKLSVISEIRDESDRNGMRAVIRLKKEANVKQILGFLFSSTNMQVSYAINMVAIAGGKPKLLNLLDIISYYTAFQRDVIVRRTKFDLNVAKERAHIVEGLLIAIKNIDAVIKIIKTSANVAEAKQRLREKFGLSDKQAQAILDMRLARLVNLEVTKLEEELKELKARIKDLQAILDSKKLQLDVVKREITEIKRKFANPRRSQEIKNEEIVLTKIEDMEDTKDYLLALSAGKTLKKVSMKNFSKSNKVLGENSTLFDIHTQVLPVKATDTVLIFTDRGNCIKTVVDKLPECKWREKGITLKNIEKTIDLMETPVAILKVEGEGELVFFTQNGMVKRSTEKDMVVAKSFYQALKLADDDKLLNVEHEVKGKTFVMLSKNGFCVNFEKTEVPVQGRVSGGVKGMNLDSGDNVVFAGQNLSDDLLIVTNNGFVKRLPTLQIPICARNRKGVKYVNFTGSGKSVAFAGATEKVVVDMGLKFVTLESKKIKVESRLSTGQEEIKKKFLGAYAFLDE